MIISVSFLVFLAGFAAVGIASQRFAGPASRDYLLAGQSISPWLAGLSAVATNNSGYMFIGVIGYTWTTGLPAIWLMVGWIVGDLVASSFIHRRLRNVTGERNASTFIGVLAGWNGEEQIRLRRLGALISLVFLGTYAAAQLMAGSKALHVLFGWPSWIGATLGAVIVVAYCLAGGIRASIWTDAAQSFVMIVAMSVLLWACVAHIGGVGATLEALDAVSPTYMSVLPTGLGLGDFWGPVLFVVGWMFAGFAVVGQPHIMIRFMALENASSMTRTRVWYYLWFTAFYFMANAVGLIARVLIPDAGAFDAELALPTLALDLLPGVLVGLILAGVFAATMSTADSLVLSCSAAATEDFAGREQSLGRVKIATLAITAFALVIALTGGGSVFDLVIGAWSVLGAAFAPLLVALVLGSRPREGLAMTMMITGVVSVYAWQAIPLLADYFDGLAGMLLGGGVWWVGRMLGLDDAAPRTR